MSDGTKVKWVAWLRSCSPEDRRKLAAALGISPNTMRNWLSGDGIIPEKHIVKLSRMAQNKTPYWLEGALAYVPESLKQKGLELLRKGHVETKQERRILQKIEKLASSRGYHPDTLLNGPVPPLQVIKGVSTLHGPDGKQKLQWVKTEIDRQHRAELFREAIEASCGSWREGIEDPGITVETQEDLLNLIPVSDYHVGMLAWGKETLNEGWDIKKAQRLLNGAVKKVLSQCPPAKTCLLAGLGDFFHSDSKKSETTSGTRVDTDSRFGKVLLSGLKIWKLMIYEALSSHEEVHVIIRYGNHDYHLAIMLAVALREAFSEVSRVQVLMEPSSRQYYRFGQCLFGFTHGHEAKADKLHGLMSEERREDWGTTKFGYWHTGHIHHDTLKDEMSVTVESHRVLIPTDGWHSAMGYRSSRGIKAITYHRDRGEVFRTTVPVSALRAEYGSG